MNTPFKGGNTITQTFGKRPEYYAQFGFAGHEGVDMVPADGDIDIYCVEGGELIRVSLAPTASAYGIYIVVLNRETKRSWWYCHLSQVYVSANQTVQRGDKIARMGNTGNSEGAHLHLGMRYADSSGNPIDVSNGYRGFVDGLPIVQQLNAAPPPVDYAKVVFALESGARLMENEGRLAERDFINANYVAAAVKLRDGG